MRKNNQTYRESGADCLDRRHTDQVKRYLLKRRERLRVVVTVLSIESTAVLSTCSAIFEGDPLLIIWLLEAPLLGRVWKQHDT
jgi:hypothetical protein